MLARWPYLSNILDRFQVNYEGTIETFFIDAEVVNLFVKLKS